MDETLTPDGTPDPVARRDDDIGRLAWRLVGDDATPPDPTAVYGLTDALREAGEHAAAHRVTEMVIRTARDVARRTERSGANRRAIVAGEFEDLRGALAWVLYSLPAAVGVLAAALARAAEPEPMTAGSAQVDIVRMRVSRNVRVGHSVTLPDGRSGIVIEAPGADGLAGVLPTGGPEADDDRYRGDEAPATSPGGGW